MADQRAPSSAVVSGTPPSAPQSTDRSDSNDGTARGVGEEADPSSGPGEDRLTDAARNCPSVGGLAAAPLFSDEGDPHHSDDATLVNMGNADGERDADGDGDLDDESAAFRRLIARGLSELGQSPDRLSHVYLKLSIPNAGITDISRLRTFQFIQTLCLAGNSISDLSCLGVMRYLTRLDVSNNCLREVLGFYPPPYNLEEIDFSRNQIKEIPDLSVHRFLKAICLDDNFITEVKGLSLRFLIHLSLARNSIASIQNLDHLPIQYLDLSSNRISSLDGLQTLVELENLNLSGNAIISLKGLSIHHRHLRTLRLESNQISDPSNLVFLQQLHFLTDLFLRDNPIEANAAVSTTSLSSPKPPETPVSPRRAYRLAVAFKLQNLTALDGLPLGHEEKVAAVNLHDPPPSVVASVQHASMLKKQTRLYAKIKAEDLMRATRLRPIVLCGPNGVGKRTLTSRLLNEFPHIFGLSVSHTTRKPRPGEENGVHYHFVSKEEMTAMIDEGKFIEVVSLFGYMYGTSTDAIDKVTEEGKVCIMDLEIEGVLALRRTHLKPRYVFITVPTLEILQDRLKGRLRSPRGQRPRSPALLNRSSQPHQLPTPAPTLPDPQGPISSRPTSSAQPRTTTPPSFGAASRELMPGERRTPVEASLAAGASGLAEGVARNHEEGQMPAGARSPIISDGMPINVGSMTGEGLAHGSEIARSVEQLADELDVELDVQKWMAKAKMMLSYSELEQVFDTRIVNDDPDRAYQELRDFCYQHVFSVLGE
ncbi:hypothetical protein DFJ73DRAFT_830474 [Zopfochytrium polystomum]|nr:hypothetical protein DFJ73DRAFT_830474 [Zopfochytrium polystomum]